MLKFTVNSHAFVHNAFDSVPHKYRLVKLQQTGLSQHVLDWISNYLSFREQRVVVNGKTSEPKVVLSGVPQGSVLRPLLLLICIYVDGVAHLPLSEGSQCVPYADDLLLFCPINTKEDFSHLQHDISLVEDWVKCNHLTLNIAKCKYMVISSH